MQIQQARQEHADGMHAPPPPALVVAEHSFMVGEKKKTKKGKTEDYCGWRGV
ncbi:hypothetical protein TSUD_102890 [Trifolium subterraneum]|uniref:Uncharacterized protein n=1 Tax=Trifolium subterraneum TaxID=3900 RepID=A0A2Z6NMH9_TRISU|nr:hypothetical protein TSUD_102890 [Trifolium subterraneum]